LRRTFSVFAWVFICALPLAPPSGAQPLGGSGLTDVTPPPARANPLDRITPVSDALLVHVPNGDWLTWRRGYDATGYSPLKAITRDNVRHSVTKICDTSLLDRDKPTGGFTVGDQGGTKPCSPSLGALRKFE
jgi:hypothetical protein